jgi:hypothetical protein
MLTLYNEFEVLHGEDGNSTETMTSKELNKNIRVKYKVMIKSQASLGIEPMTLRLADQLSTAEPLRHVIVQMWSNLFIKK